LTCKTSGQKKNEFRANYSTILGGHGCAGRV